MDEVTQEYRVCPKCKIASLEVHSSKEEWDNLTNLFKESKIVGGHIDWRCLKCFRVWREIREPTE